MAREQYVHRAFQAAAEAVRQRIRDDQERVGEGEVREMLRAMEREIFTPGFEVGSLNAGAAAKAEFAAVLGVTPSVYYRVRLIEAVLFMLDHTDADVIEIAPHVGYEYPQSLVRAFKKMLGHTPKEERRLWREKLDPNRDAPPPSIAVPEGWTVAEEAPEDFRLDRAPELRRAVAGGMRRREAGMFLLNLYFTLPLGQWTSSATSAIAQWIDSMAPAASKEGAEALRPAARQPSSRDLTMDEELAYLEQAARATFAVQDQFEADWLKGPGTDGLPEAIARLRAITFEQGSSLEEMKAEYRLTATELSRFSPNLGLSPWQYVVETRMEVTARLLCDTPMSILGISWNVGYADPRQLRRAFRKWSGGLSLDRYRQRSRQAAQKSGESPPDRMHWKVLELTQRPEENLEEMQRLLRSLHAVYQVPVGFLEYRVTENSEVS